MAVRSLERKQLGGRVIGALLAERRVVGPAYGGGEPEPAGLVEHRVVVVDPRVPDGLRAPVGGRLHRGERRGVAWTEAQRHVGIPHRRPVGRRRILDRIQNRQRVRAVLGRPVERAVRIDRRVPSIARDQVVQVVLLVHPVAQRDDDIALDTLGPRRPGVRQLPLRNAIGPFAEVLERNTGELVRELAGHLLSGLTRLHAAPPRLFR